jgi:hypothetical protein
MRETNTLRFRVGADAARECAASAEVTRALFRQCVRRRVGRVARADAARFGAEGS